MNVQARNVNTPNWKIVTVHSQIPEPLKKLKEMAGNMWWTWNDEAINLFKNINLELFKASNCNALEMLLNMSYDELIEVSRSKRIIEEMNNVYDHFSAYMEATPDTSRPSVAYFCMEYGLDHFLKIYSGGLGILAGDYLKQASDSNVNLTGIGLLYRYGYFTQELAMDGSQIAKYEAQDFEKLPLAKVMEGDKQMVVDVPFPGYTLHALVWRVDVGRIKLYLLDTDNDMNSEYDRPITHTLYGGEWENRIKQEMLLGIGGMLMLHKLGICCDVYHCNEGHAALCNVQRLVDYVNTGLTFNQALELVRASSLYTVHTPVPAGHDYFEESLFGKYLGAYPQKLGISWQDFIGLGRTNPNDNGEKFCMSTFLCKTCQEVNGVSKLHGIVSQKMFNNIWGGYYPEENHVGYVTNGVHMPTWAAGDWKTFYEEHFGKDFYKDQSNQAIWEKIYKVPDEEIWELRTKQKMYLIKFIRDRFRKSWLKNHGDPSRVVSLLEKIKPDALLIGFGRRFATYKRAHLLFHDLERLKKIVNNPNYPVQFIYTGKAHPADGAGQGLIKRIYELSQSPDFLGKILFLENYDMQLARRLISGVDIWMNTPTRPLEASGTSGEKALMNGLLNLSVLDGWWLEGYREGAGWALTEKRTYQNQDYQDRLDASTIYSLLEHEIIPLYYTRNERGYSTNWIRCIKNSIAQIAPHYTMKRQLDDYFEKFYNKEAERFKYLAANDNAKAKEIVLWKEKVANAWNSVEILSVNSPDEPFNSTFLSGEKYEISILIDEKVLKGDIGLECVIIGTNADGQEYVYNVAPFEIIHREGSVATYKLLLNIDNTGKFKLGYRMYPINKDLPHRQDFCYVRWI